MKQKRKSESMDNFKEFEPIFYPKSIAVIGASNDERKFGARFLRTLQEFGYGGELYPINPRQVEVSGLKAYPTVRDIPQPVDFAAITVPARLVPQVLEDCLVQGVKAAEIFTAGFGETGEEEGRQLEAQLMGIARRGIRVIGPNCFGVYCPGGGVTMLPGADFPKETGPVAFISQSGGHAVELARQARGWGISFSKVISYGNACDINEADLLEYLAQDSETKIIAAYIEGPRQGERFRHLVQAVSWTKPVLIWKAGLTQDGARAVSSHTASLSGEETTWDALFKQTGALQMDSLEEIIDTAVALMHLPASTGRRVAVIGGGGGISVAAADACNQAGLRIPTFKEPLQRELKQILPPAGTAVRNPVDVGAPVVPTGVWHRVWQKVAAAEGVDTIIATQALHLFRGERWRHFFDTRGSSISDSLQIPVDIKSTLGKPVIMVLPVGSIEVDMLEAEKARRQFRDFYLRNGIPVYPTLERAARAIAKVVQYYERRAQA